MNRALAAHRFIAPDIKAGRDVPVFGSANVHACDVGKNLETAPLSQSASFDPRASSSSYSPLHVGVTLEDGHNKKVSENGSDGANGSALTY